MELRICKNSEELGKSAAKHVAQVLRDVIAEKGYARLCLSTGASQFDTLKALVEEKGIQWDKVEMFHLDEYVDLPITHVASFRKYLQERFVKRYQQQYSWLGQCFLCQSLRLPQYLPVNYGCLLP